VMLSQEVFDIIDRLHKSDSVLIGSLDPYQPCLRTSIGSLLELLSGVFCEFDSGDAEILDVDYGLQPTSPDEAWKKLPAFIDTCREHFAMATLGHYAIPAMEMHSRSFTYSCLLREAGEEDIEDSSGKSN